MEVLPILDERGSTVSRRLVECKGCTECCERGGLVYLREDEVARLSAKGVPILRVGGVAFVRRLADGSCPMLHKEARECSIYEDRPLCCRLFPLDGLSVKGQLRWAISDICPQGRRRFGRSQGGPNSAIGTGSLARITSALNGSIGLDTVRFFHSKETASARVQRLEDAPDSWTPLGAFEAADVSDGTVLGASRKETKKEKLKKKLKKKRKRK